MDKEPKLFYYVMSQLWTAIATVAAIGFLQGLSPWPVILALPCACLFLVVNYNNMTRP